MGPDGTKIMTLEKILCAFRTWNDQIICAEVFYEYSQSIQIPLGSLDVKWFFSGLLLAA